jgi:hypothetical protein
MPAPNPGAAQRALAELLADPERGNAAIARAARCSAATVKAARRALRAAPADQAHPVAMGNKTGSRLRLPPDDPHAPLAAQDPHNREPARYREPPDAIERICPACTLEYRDGGWHHDRGCIFAGHRAGRAG